MKRILFVDDDPNILDGLRRMLRPQRREWEMKFANSGAEALDFAQECAFEAVVTDMRMPGMDGAELLAHFVELHPHTVRFVLSGHSELEGVMRTVPIAHQFLSKPCSAENLRDSVTRALELSALLNDVQTQELIGETDALPSRPETYSAIVSALADPEVEISTVSRIVESDVAMSAKLLQLVNSSFFGLPQNLADVSQAVSFLGLNMIRDLALSIEVFKPPADADAQTTRMLSDLQTRSAWVAAISREMFEDKRQASEAFTAGMLHDIGLLVIATHLPERFSEILRAGRERSEPLHLVEQDLYGVTHAEIGAYLLGVWGLPYSIMEVAAYHHRPDVLPQEVVGPLTAVHVADAIVDARLREVEDAPTCGTAINLEYLERLGLASELERWEAIADEVLSRGTDE